MDLDTRLVLGTLGDRDASTVSFVPNQLFTIVSSSLVQCVCWWGGGSIEAGVVEASLARSVCVRV